MEAKFHESIDEFYDLVYPFLLKHEAENNLPLAILISLKKNFSRYGEEKPLLFSLISEKKLQLIAIRTPPHDLIISYTDNVKSVSFLVDALYERGEEFPGVLSFKEAADMFAKLWCKKKSVKCNLFRRERVYQLKRVSEECIGDKQFSVATKPHKALVLRWAGEMMKEAMSDATDKDIEKSRKNFVKEFEETKSSFYILFDNDEPVSIARKAGKTPNGNFVNFVYKPS